MRKVSIERVGILEHLEESSPHTVNSFLFFKPQLKYNILEKSLPDSTHDNNVNNCNIFIALVK